MGDGKESINLLIIHLGGTFGMKNTGSCLKNIPGLLETAINASNILNHAEEKEKPFYSFAGRTLYYDIFEEEIKDSSNADLRDWEKLSRILNAKYHRYDAFIVINGTDTLAYAASAISFMIENITKPVIFTGSMIPILENNNDAVGNLEGAFKSILSNIEPYVYIYFNGRMMKANRCTKADSNDFNGFYEKKKPTNLIKGQNFRIYTNLSKSVGLVKLYPGITFEAIKSMISNCEGFVLESFGAGNIPLNIIEDLIDLSHTKYIVNISQCIEGDVANIYESGSILYTKGKVIPGGDMTTESAFTKLSFLLGNFPSERIRSNMETNLRGEL